MSEVKIPEGYKQTEVGVIPEDWNIDTIGNISNFRNGVAHEKFIDPDGKYIAVNSRFISTEGEVVKRTKELRNAASKNEILMVMSDVPNGRAIAKCFLVPKDNVYSVNQRICALSIINDNPKYIFYQLNRNPYYLAFDDGVKQTNLRRQDVLDCPLAIPSIEEQTVIANALTDTDNLIQSLEKLIAKKQAIKTGTMQQLLTGKTRLPEFATREDGSLKGFKQTELGMIPEDWQTVSLGSIANFLKGSGLSKSDLVDDGEYKCIHYGQLFTLYNEKISKVYSSTNIYGNVKSISNDILMPTSDVTPNGLATASCILEDNIVLGGDILIIRSDLKVLNGVYFAYLLNIYREQVMRLVTGSTVYHLYGSTMSKLTINLPNIKEQITIAIILSDMDAEIQALQDRLEKTKQIKQGMMQQLLTGKVRLV